MCLLLPNKAHFREEKTGCRSHKTQGGTIYQAAKNQYLKNLTYYKLNKYFLCVNAFYVENMNNSKNLSLKLDFRRRLSVSITS